MSGSTAQASNGFFAYAIRGLLLAAVFAAMNSVPGDVVTSVWEMVARSDIGNAIAALVTVAGYMLEMWNSRKSRQLDAQIERVQAQSQNFLVPVTTQFHSLCMGGMLSFVDSQIDEIISSKEGSKLVEVLHKSSPQFCSGPCTMLKNPASDAFLLQIMRASPRADGGFFFQALSDREFPMELHNALKKCKRPNSKLWKDYESFIRNEFEPGVERIAQIIDEYGHLMEPIGHFKLQEIFGGDTGIGRTWKFLPRMWFYSMWLSYARSWKTVVAAWDDGVYDRIRPCAPFPVGLMRFNIEAQTIVANTEQKLVGMSQMHGNSSS